MENIQKYLPAIIIGVLIIAAVYVYSTSSGGTTNTLVPGTDNSAQNAANANTNAQLAIQHEQDVLGGFGQLVSFATSADNNATALATTESNNRAGVIVNNQNTQASIAQTNAAVETAQAQAHALQQASVWSSIGSIFGSAISHFPLTSTRATTVASNPVSVPGPNGVPIVNQAIASYI